MTAGIIVNLVGLNEFLHVAVQGAVVGADTDAHIAVTVL